ncbi:ATP-binding protein, partial [Cohnella sp. REN36]|uniref:ATP-binding protein n=1 Tax=Cohnella sp. REN36 TaxID=2887347 RepID=UPI00351D3D36|nr:hypothetical protein [Cohnella sp. REN36]
AGGRGALAGAGAPGADAYELRLRVDERRRALRLARREAELRLEAGRDAAGLAELAALLGGHDEAALGLMAERARTDLADREAERSEALDRRGRLAQELERLRREAELEERTQALEECRSELDRHLDRYAMLALTAELIRRTKRSFEEERQPEVLRAASHHFAEMTGGAYVRIVAPGDEATLLAETPDRRLVDSSFLSRGTQEQMYLSLRLALAAAASPSQALPLLLDDLFVHFDADRLARAVQVVGRIARERQTLLFTCHAHVAHAFRQGLPEAGFVTLPGREDAAAR